MKITHTIIKSVAGFGALSLVIMLNSATLNADNIETENLLSRPELKQLIHEVVREELAAMQAAMPEKASVGVMSEAAMLTHSCAGCHGTNGRVSDAAFMPLAGMPQQEFINTMLDFRNDKRTGTLMGHVAKGYSEAEIALMASYYASLSDSLLTDPESE